MVRKKSTATADAADYSRTPGEAVAEKRATGRNGRSSGDRRQAILDAATRRFAANGFLATTCRQIADDVNILSGSLFYHFATKEQMLLEIVRETSLRLMNHAKAVAQFPVDAESRMGALIISQIRDVSDHPDVHAILYNERHLFREDGDFSDIRHAKKEAYFAWKSIAKDGFSEELFRADADSYLTISTSLRTLYTGADWFSNEHDYMADSVGHHSLDEIIDFFLSWILGVLRTPARTSDPIARASYEAILDSL